MMYWPMINILMWGFVSLYIVQQFTNAAVVTGVFLAGVLLCEFFVRTSISMMVMYIEEVWSRNLGHLFASPLKFTDYAIGILGLSMVRIVVSVIPAIIVTKYLFGFSLFSLGWPVALYAVLLTMSGWWYGLCIVSLMLRFGLAAEWLGWMSSWLLIPLIAPYYPVSVLPHWLQIISWSLPPTYVFESMKSLTATHDLHSDYLWTALYLNIFYMAAAAFIFYRAYRGARQRGGLLQVGE